MWPKIALACIALFCTAADGDFSNEAPPWIQAGAVGALAGLMIWEQKKITKAVESINVKLGIIGDRQKRRLKIANSDNPPFGESDDEEDRKG